MKSLLQKRLANPGPGNDGVFHFIPEITNQPEEAGEKQAISGQVDGNLCP